MENSVRVNKGIEENTMAILDASGVRDSRDVEDDRLAFLEAVRASSIVPENGTAPTRKMCEAIFQILKDGKSLELTMASYNILIALDKRFPRVYLSNSDKSNSACNAALELVVVNEAWSPFVLCSEGGYREKDTTDKNLGEPTDSLGFHLLIQEMIQMVDEMSSGALDMKYLRKMLLFQYLVNVLEEDFVPRNTAYKGTMNWALLRESLLNMLLGSRRTSYKGIIKDSMTLISKRYHPHVALGFHDLQNAEMSSAKALQSCDAAASIAAVEMLDGTFNAVQKLLILGMELDVSKKHADSEGYTTRLDGIRTPVVEIILDELTYNKDFLSPFLQVFSVPVKKLEIILLYFSKYIVKPSVRTRKTNPPSDMTTFDGVLKYFSNSTSTRSITKKIGIDVAQLLLAHAFQAYLSIEPSVKGIADSGNEKEGSSLVQICKNVLSAFRCLQIDEQVEVMPLMREALFTAATILSTKS